MKAEAGGDRSEEAVKESERRRYRAMIDGDVDALEGHLDDLLLYTHSNSAVDTKTSYLERVRAGHFRYTRIEIEEESLVVIADVAILRGRMKAEGFLGGTALLLDNRFLGVSRFKDDRWQLLAYQPTPVPPPI